MTRHLTVERLIAGIDTEPPVDAGWRVYVRERYGV